METMFKNSFPQACDALREGSHFLRYDKYELPKFSRIKKIKKTYQIYQKKYDSINFVFL